MQILLSIVAIATLVVRTKAIVGGLPAEESMSFTVALVQPRLEGNPRGYTSFLCDGILISPTAVLTATECITHLPAKDISIRSGFTTATQINTTVSEIITMQPHNSSTLSYNLAILRPSTPITNVKAADLAQPEPTDPPASQGGRLRITPLRIVGWGPTSNRTQGISPVLTIAPVDTVALDLCAEKLSTCGFTFSPQEKLCTSSDARGAAAFGDVGGPVVDDQGLVVAMISGNPGCAQPNALGLKLSVRDPAVGAFVRQHTGLPA